MPVNYTIGKQLPSSIILRTLGHEIWKSHVSYSKEHYEKSTADLWNRQTWTDKNLKYQPWDGLPQEGTQSNER